jgi:hypothetical protein
MIVRAALLVIPLVLFIIAGIFLVRGLFVGSLPLGALVLFILAIGYVASGAWRRVSEGHDGI